MDKVKVILGHVQKHHFWLLCVVAVIAGLFGWTKARSKLSTEFTANKGTVSGKFEALRGIQNDPNPPNNTWAEQISTLTKQEQTEVAAAWKTVYDAQQKVLAWPAVMPDAFKNWIKTAPPDADIFPGWIQVYQTEVIKTEFPKLARIVDAAPLVEVDARAPAGGAAAPAADPAAPKPTYKVDWENQEKLKKSLDMSGARASSFAVRMRQEDLWVLESVLKVLAKTNEGAQYSSRVKRIEDLSIGADTAAAFAKGMQPGHIDRLSAAGEGGGEAAMVDSGGAMGGEEGAEVQPDENRYVDAEGKPMASGAWKEQQFKRMPVHLRLVMDQREITRLLAACANSPLPIEVRQLRINPGAESSGSPAKKADAGADGPTATAADVYDVVVEISGIIYIFNPPDPARLGAGGEGTQAAG